MRLERLLHVNSNSTQLKVGALLTYIQLALSTIISLVYTPAMLRLLGQTEYGLYNIAATVVSYVNLLNMGFASSYIRFYSRSKACNDYEEVKKTNGLFMIVFAVIGVLALIAGLIIASSAKIIFSNGLSSSEYDIIRKIIIILSISTAYNLGTSLFSSIITAQEEFVFLKTVNLIKTVLSPTLIWILLLNGYKSIMMATVTSLLIIISDTIYVIFCFAKLDVKFSFKNLNKGAIFEVSTFSGFIAVNSIVDQINWSVDKILLGRFWGARYTAVYSVAAQINSIYMQLSTGVSNVFIPRINRLVAEEKTDKEITDLFIKIGRLQTMVLLPVILGFIFLGKQFISIWAPREYSDAYIIALLLMGPTTIPYIQNAGVSIQTAKNKHQFRALIYTIMAIINLAISILLCRQFGGIGCAVGTAVSIIAANIVIMNIYYHRKLKLNMIRFWKDEFTFFPCVIILSIVGIFIKLFVVVNNYRILLLCGLFFVIVYVITLWIFSLNNYEKKMILQIIQKKRDI